MLSETEIRGLHRRLTSSLTGEVNAIERIFEKVSSSDKRPAGIHRLMRSLVDLLEDNPRIIIKEFYSVGKRTAGIDIVYSQAKDHPLLEKRGAKGLLFKGSSIGMTRSIDPKFRLDRPVVFVDAHAIFRFFERTDVNVVPHGDGFELLVELTGPVGIGARLQEGLISQMRGAQATWDFFQNKRVLLPGRSDGVFMGRWRNVQLGDGVSFFLDVRTYLRIDQLNASQRESVARIKRVESDIIDRRVKDEQIYDTLCLFDKDKLIDDIVMSKGILDKSNYVEIEGRGHNVARLSSSRGR